MRRFRSFILALSALFLLGPKADAQFAYTIESFQPFYNPVTGGFVSGFTATVLFENVNTYYDPTIIRVLGFSAGPSQVLRDYCWWFRGADGCYMAGSGMVARGNVETSDIYFGPGDGRYPDIYDYNGGFTVDSCGGSCLSQHYYASGGAGLLGCQAKFPLYSLYYNGRTCDEDGYDGKFAVNLRFSVLVPASAPVFPYRPSDIMLTATNVEDHNPNAFVHATPEPATLVLMASGLALVGATVRKRERR